MDMYASAELRYMAFPAPDKVTIRNFRVDFTVIIPKTKVILSG